MVEIPAIPQPPAKAVLIVDDDPLVRQILDAWLSRGGYRTHHAADAESAIELLAAQSIGVALCDQTMPGRGGEWLVAQMRERFPAVAIVLATGSDVPLRISTQSSVVGHMEKPFSRVIVMNAIADAMLWHQVAARKR